ncbi:MULTISPECIES: hypothetical protein [Caloramator]|uniref:TPR-repeat-containing protein n=1 Tax=Caloramator australicus RC3 TaxID=857293 RepID=I7KTK1_9CLOT|nr:MULTISPECIES: hypothetical protein [Caloramator]MDO6354887.1 hypothetical protein [Caloramator sp. CAR-1]CCJ33123.1 TPR-repeat-containing protein [Caloramator australicus RC3]
MLQSIINKGFYYAKKGDLKRAQRIFDFIIKTREYTPEVLHASGVILLYYGEFKKALKLLKFNAKNNLYQPSKEIVENIEEIKKYVEDFNKALNEFKMNSFNKVIDLLENYRQRGFLTYDAQKLLTLAYYKQKRIDDCKKLLKEIDEIYPFNDFTKEVYKELNGLYYNAKKFYEKAVVCLLLIVMLGPMYFIGFRNKEVNKPKKIHAYHVNDKFYELLKNYLEGDYCGFEKTKGKTDLRGFNEKELLIFNLIQKQYEQIDLSYFYNQGLKAFRKKDYKRASEYFEIANKIQSDSYLKEHILFFLASSYKYFDKEKAICYYNEYINKYIDGCYRAETLYTLTLISTDKAEAFRYALQIEKEYKDTIYYNSKIKKILREYN